MLLGFDDNKIGVCESVWCSCQCPPKSPHLLDVRLSHELILPHSLLNIAR